MPRTTTTTIERFQDARHSSVKQLAAAVGRCRQTVHEWFQAGCPSERPYSEVRVRLWARAAGIDGLSEPTPAIAALLGPSGQVVDALFSPTTATGCPAPNLSVVARGRAAQLLHDVRTRAAASFRSVLRESARALDPGHATVEQLAAAIGRSRQTVHEWFKAGCPSEKPYSEVLVRLWARAAGFDVLKEPTPKLAALLGSATALELLGELGDQVVAALIPLLAEDTSSALLSLSIVRELVGQLVHDVGARAAASSRFAPHSHLDARAPEVPPGAGTGVGPFDGGMELQSHE